LGIQEQIDDIEEEIKKTQYNKATEFHVGKLKAKLAKLRADQEKRREEGKGGGKGYAVKKSGHATVAIVGFPSVGKSTILNMLTGSQSETGAYQFTTLSIFPGILEYKGAKIQILDMPGLIEGASRGKGRGREVIAAARNADLILLCVDAFNYRLDILIRELEMAGFRLNQTPPRVSLSGKTQGGISVNFTVKPTRLDEDMARGIVSAYGHVNADVVIREDISQDQLIDFLTGNKVYVRSVLAINKKDLVDTKTIKKIAKELSAWNPVPVSAVTGSGMETLKETIFQRLRFIRLYMKPQNQEADMKEPLVVPDGATVGTVCDHLHRDFRRNFRYAQVWGKSAKFPGQMVGIDHRLKDGDIVSVIIRR